MSCTITKLIEEIDRVIYSPNSLSDEDLPLISRLCWEAIQQGDDYVDEKLSDYQIRISHITSLKTPSRKAALLAELVRSLRLAKKQLATIRDQKKEANNKGCCEWVRNEPIRLRPLVEQARSGL
jgi:hypothetical protein